MFFSGPYLPRLATTPVQASWLHYLEVTQFIYDKEILMALFLPYYLV